MMQKHLSTGPDTVRRRQLTQRLLAEPWGSFNCLASSGCSETGRGAVAGSACSCPGSSSALSFLVTGSSASLSSAGDVASSVLGPFFCRGRMAVASLAPGQPLVLPVVLLAAESGLLLGLLQELRCFLAGIGHQRIRLAGGVHLHPLGLGE